MTEKRLIHCTKLKKDLSGLAYPPYPGPLGEKIFAEISQEAWEMWLAKQTMLINEKRLNTRDPKTTETIEKAMYAFLFEDQDIDVAGYVPE